MKLPLIAISCLLLAGCAELKKATDTAQPYADVSCTVLEAVTKDEVVHTVCATEKELADIVNQLSSLQAPDAGAAKKIGQCSLVPNTMVCASTENLAIAIDTVRARRVLK